MKRLLLSFLLFLPLLVVNAQRVKIGDLYYNLDSSNMTAEVTSYDLNSNQKYVSGDLTIPNIVSYNGEEFSVTSIGNYAFYHCSGLTSVTIPNFVTSIGNYAFYHCTGLTSVTIPNSVATIGDSAFEGCSGLTSVTIPNSVTSIGYGAFYGCSGLTSVTIGSSVTSIGNSAFYGCSGLASVTIPNSVTSIGVRAFEGCSSLASVTIPNSITSIGNSAFSYCSGLTSVTIPNSVTSIGNYAFYHCSGLTSVTIPSSVTSIANSVFDGCTSIKEVTIEDGESTLTLGYNNSSSGLFDSSPLERIYLGRNLSYAYGSSYGYSPFANQKNLTEVTIGTAVTSIGDYLFYNCSSVTNVTIGNSVTSIGNSAFYNCSSLTNITIPNSVTSIGKSAFLGCSSIKEVTIEDGESTLSLRYNSSSSGQFGSCPLEKVYIGRNLSYSSGTPYGYSPFANQPNLTEATIGTDVTSINEYLFYNCSGLQSITIPNSVTSIGNSAFKGCSSIKEVTIEDGESTLSLGYSYATYSGIGLFEDCPLETVYIGRNLSYQSGVNFGYSPFANQKNLMEVMIGNSVTSIGSYAFYGCSGLASVTIPNSVTSIGNSAFYGCSGLASVTIPNSVTSIGSYAFYGCSGLASVTIPNSVTSIGNSAFSYCSGLASVTIPNSVTSIGNYAFYHCSGLTSVTIPSSVTSIANSVFDGCTSIKEVTIEDGESTLTLGYNNSSSGLFDSSPLEQVYLGRNLSYAYGSSYGYSPFANQKNLTEVTIGTAVTSIGDYLFYNCSSVTNVTIGNSVTSIGNSAFYNCSSLTNITIPNSVTSIGDYAFYDCSGLKNVTIPNYVTSIGNGLFYNCSSLTSVTIPNSVTEIRDEAFLGCNNLKNINYDASSEFANLSSNAFEGAHFKNTSLLVTYPEKTLEILDDPNWKKFQHIYYFLEDKKYVPVIWDNTLIPDNVIFSNDKGCLVQLGSEVTLRSNEEVIMATYNGESIKDELDSADGFSFLPSEKWEDNHIFVSLENSENSRNVTVSPAGNLFNEVGLQNIEKITSLKISGYLNGTDIMTINRMTSLVNLDISEASIVAGGQTYRENLKTENDVIGKNFFSDCKNLKNLVLSNTALTIDNSAFEGMNKLVNIVIGTNTQTIKNRAFYNCSSLHHITIPNSVTSIANYVFDGCTSIKEVTIEDGESTLSLGYNNSSSGLFGSSPLERIYLGRDLSYAYGSSYGYSPFANQKNLTEVTIGTAVTSIGDYLFYNCSSVTNVTIGSSVISIGSYAFYHCSSLTNITIPNSVTSIGNSAFLGCSSIKEVTIEDGESTLSLGYNSSSSGQFGSCPLEKVYIGRNLSYSSGTSYGYSPFANQQNLTEVTIGTDVTSINDYLFYNCSGLQNITIPNSVTSIGNNAFSSCSGLISVTIPNSVTSIGGYAFYGCSSINEINIEDGLSTLSLGYNSYSSNGAGIGLFGDCPLEKVYIGRNLSYNSGSSYGYSPFANQKNLTEVTIGSSVTSIGDYAFWGCTGLSSVIIPNSVTSIGRDAFNGCTGLVRVDISDMDAWCRISFNNGTSNPLYYACNLYLSGELVINLEIPTTVSNILNYTFYNCHSIKTLSIPESVTSIGGYAFCDCSGLSSITIPNSVTSIGGYAFYGCSRLTTVKIGNSVTSIDGYAFGGCTGLERVDITDMDAWYRISFKNESSNPLYYGHNLYLHDELVIDLEIPTTVSNILNYTFYNCQSIKTLSIPESVISIGNKPFYGCSGLEEVILPNSLTSIPDYCFAECTGLANLRLGTGLTFIDNSAFQNCSSLAQIVSLNPTPPVITTQVFSAVNKETCLLVVTKGNLVHYWLDPVWKKFLNMSDDLIFLNPLPSATYGEDAIDLAEYAPAGVTLTYETSNPDVARIDGSLLTIVGAGTATIGAIYDTKGAPMEIIGQMRQFVIEKADLNLAPMDCTIEYGSALPDFTLLVDGLCYDDTLEDVGELPEFYCEADEDSEPGEYPIYLVGGASSNYNLNVHAGTLTIVDKIENSLIEKVVTEKGEDGNVKVFNLNGVQIYEGLKDEMNLSSGVYIIVTESGKTYKIVK